MSEGQKAKLFSPPRSHHCWITTFHESNIL